MAAISLLPPRNATAFMRALEQTVAIEERVLSGVELIADIKRRQLPSFVQFLLYEYGLIELTPYVTNPYTLLAEGREWQIERDTLAAIHRGLGWVANPATIEEAPTRRNWWNSFQLRFNALPAEDFPTLDRIDRITQLGKPFRSDFRRGVFGYDAPALEADMTRLDECLLDDESGVRLRDGGPLWSFGRSLDYQHTMTEVEGVALGNYITPTGSQSLLIDFLTGEAKVGDVDVDLSDVATLTRASPKTATNAAGDLIAFATDVAAITDIGYSIESETTNFILRNGDANQWPLPVSNEGLTISVVGQGEVNGIEYSDIRVHGVTNDQRGLFLPFVDDVAATIGDVWTVSAYIAIVGGSAVGLEDFSLSGVDISGLGGTMTRLSVTGSVPNLAVVSPGIQIGYESGVSVDITIRVGYPQAEKGGSASSVIVSADVPTVRAPDHLVIHLPAGLHNVKFTFDDNSTLMVEGKVGDFSVNRTDLPRTIIKKIVATQLEGLESLRWLDLRFPWSQAQFPWVSPAGNARRIFLATWFSDRVGYLALRRADGTLIGYRRARAVKQVNPSVDGIYTVNGVSYLPNPNGEFVVIDAMTDAGDGAGEIAASVSFAFNGTRAAGIPPGRLWLEPGELIAPVEIALKPVSIALRETVRDRVKLLLRF